jgi:uncharacterized protein (TIGR04255 family)
LDLEEQNVKKYKSNYLTNVIFRVDFPKILDLDLKKPTAEFQKRIYKKYPLVKEIGIDSVELNFQEEGDVRTTKEKGRAWEFSNKESTKKLFIAPDHFFIEYLEYEHFKELLKDIELIYDAFTELYHVEIAIRIGLRYINEIEIKEGYAFDWSNLINQSLYSLTRDFTSKDEKVLRSMHLLEVLEKDYNLKFQFGFANSEYPNPIARKEFVLDYDCSTTQNTDISELIKIAKEFNLIIYNWFERSIEEDLRKKMEVLDAT